VVPVVPVATVAAMTRVLTVARGVPAASVLIVASVAVRSVSTCGHVVLPLTPATYPLGVYTGQTFAPFGVSVQAIYP
jgi:hypothetical protein